jgi:hypothetical protein
VQPKLEQTQFKSSSLAGGTRFSAHQQRAHERHLALGEALNYPIARVLNLGAATVVYQRALIVQQRRLALDVGLAGPTEPRQPNPLRAIPRARGRG